nr:MAG TPA: hypothetical protein [Caudoviricetes sp.]
MGLFRFFKNHNSIITWKLGFILGPIRAHFGSN